MAFPVRISVKKVSFQAQCFRFMAMLSLRECCFRSDRVKRFSESQKLWDGRDFVGFLVRRHLPQGQAELGRPNADRMQCTQALVAIVAAPQRLSVNRKHGLFDADRTRR